MCGHTMDECKMLKIQYRQAKQKESKHFEKEKKYTKHEVDVEVGKKVNKVLKKKTRRHTEEPHTFGKMSLSNSGQESINRSSSEEGKI